MQALLGIDIGTSGCKALLIGTDGAVIAADTATYPLSQPHPGWTEQDPELWVAGARQAVAGALAAAPQVEILCIGLSGQMHGLTPLDAGHRVLRPAILWNDQRTFAECDEIERLTGGRIAEWTLNEPRTAFTASKILWARKHLPEVWARTRTVLLPKDYVPCSSRRHGGP